MNKITIYGRLTSDIETKQTQSGVSVANVRVASNGRNKEEVNYFDCKAFKGLADTMAKYIHKGDPLVIYGSMHQFEYTKQDGTKVRAWEVLIDDIDFVPKGEKKQAQEAEPVVEEIQADLPF